ncbi:TauD/TfdA family dioxygenase [Nostocaceae cyanobacterium CENA357]|uniref:TauD/TfdA family dioxygenase n=1 Tax=Atlanticothrix silvestris CENA357 TaxID=1725252 RepID=A0A8J7HJR4_9CYAN|nr:TauD/TfdA family dioxygenase [Atlanticothrix silvestris]MBH8553705.1 TauD/TfdA family dioxygenase [Atlanticothrix silvestris CENA357]
MNICTQPISEGLGKQIINDDSVRIEYIFSAVTSSRCGNHQVFINSILPTMQLNPEVLRFEDDSEIPADVMKELNEIAERLTTEMAWQKGDILMIDNTKIMHGRRNFTDEKRNIYIRLCSPAFSCLKM